MLVPSKTLVAQIDRMVENDADYIPEADGVDGTAHVVVNEFSDGVWLCEHHDSCNMIEFTRLQRLR
jgi:hypothetical protein